MKALLLALFSLCFVVSVVGLTHDVPNQAPRKILAAPRARLISIMGTVQQNGDKLRFVTEQRAWNVDNPEILKGHEGHYVRVNAHLDPDKDSIHIRGVKMPTASETKKDNTK